MKAEVEWDDYNWVATVTGQDNVFTFAKQLNQLPDRLTEVMHLMTGSDVAPAEWDLVVHYGDLGDDAMTIRREREEIDEAERRLSQRTIEVVKALRERGMSLRDIGTMTGLTYQRIHQLVS